MRGEFFSLYLYDADTGQLVRVVKDIDEMLAKPMAIDYHATDGYDVKMVDQFDGVITYTLG